MSTASHIIDLFGGTRPAASKLGLAVSTVQSWKTKGYIPAPHQQNVLDKARALGIAVTPASFFEVNGAHLGADDSTSEKVVQVEDEPARAAAANGAADAP